ncbi:MAG: alanine--tRNA ligase-related protein, partial [Candidatus Ranarchaeia archaeon]
VIERMKKESGIAIDHGLHTKYAELSAALDVENAADIQRIWGRIAGELNLSLQRLRDTMEPLHALYAIADHTRTLTFAIADGAIPSNVGGGYNLRVVLRRALSFIRKHGFPFGIQDISRWHIDWLRPFFPELEDEKGQIEKILEVEIERARENIKRTKAMVSSLLKKIPKTSIKNKTVRLPAKQLVELYESHGVTPEQLQAAAASQGFSLQVPPDVYAQLTQTHEKAQPAEEDRKKQREATLKSQMVKGLAPTRPLYYEDSHKKEFTAKILKIFNKQKSIILDATLFYPESGGQPSDKGVIAGINVVEVEKIGQVIVHTLAEALGPGYTAGSIVDGSIDWKYRFQHMQHHSSTHLVLSAARKILGNHVWQNGSQIGQEQARIDVSHYAALEQDELDAIEQLSNQFVQRNAPIKAMFLPRREAEDKYGFRLYQGGVVPGKTIRIVETKGIDVEACGGTHLSATGEAGLIIINRAKRIQDGVVRIEFSSGSAAIHKLQTQRRLLKQTADILRVTPEKTPATAKRFFDEWREAKKQLDNVPAAPEIAPVDLGGIKGYIRLTQTGHVKRLLKEADAISRTDPRSLALLVTAKPTTRFVIGVGDQTGLDPLKLARSLAQRLGGGAGHVDKHLAQGGGKTRTIEDTKKIIQEFKESLTRQLRRGAAHDPAP